MSRTFPWEMSAAASLTKGEATNAAGRVGPSGEGRKAHFAGFL
jgi:hypothetical protein